MIKVNVYEVKAKLSEYLDRAIQGEEIVICRHNKPVAHLRAVAPVQASPRPVGPLRGRPTFEVPASFFEPLSNDDLELWEGVAPTDPLASAWAVAPRAAKKVAEKASEYKPRRTRGGGRQS